MAEAARLLGVTRGAWHVRRDAADYSGARRWQRLEAACLSADVTLDGAHRALGDARATLGLLRAMAGC